jgi:hypothetical protein
MKFATAFSTQRDTAHAIRAAIAQLADQLEEQPTWLLLYTSDSYESDVLLRELHNYAPDVPLHGATSCLGAMTQLGFHSSEGVGLALLGIVDRAGRYGVGSAELSQNPRQAGSDAIFAAIENAGRSGEPPALVWISGAPGHEEAILEGIQDVIGRNVPIAGGSSADNAVAGNWQQFANGNHYANAVVVTALYPSVPLHHAFHSGYSTTLLQGTITKATGRTLYEIDGKPAAALYNEWTGGAVTDALAFGGNVLANTTLFPLGRRVTTADEYATYRLAHPDTVTDDGALTLFANVEEGEELILMSGTTQGLVERAGRVAQSALWAGRVSPDQLSGALAIYCAGCMLTVQDKMAAVVDEIKQALGDAPFIGTFTFGEQGCFNNGENHHGNLMISIVVFEKTKS